MTPLPARWARTQHAVDTAARRGVAEPAAPAATTTLGTLAKEPRPAVTYHPPGVVSPTKHSRASEKAYDAWLNRVYDELLARRDPRDNAPIHCYRQRKTSSCWMGGGRQQSTGEKQPHQAHTPPRAFSASFVAGPVLVIADAAPQPTRRLSLRLLWPPPSLSLSSSPSPSLLAAPLLWRATPTTTPTITASHEEWVRRN
jgi:hypothetical protein